MARVLGLLVRLLPGPPLPTAAEHRARVEAVRAEAALLPPERQGLIAQGDLCRARTRKAARETARLREALAGRFSPMSLAGENEALRDTLRRLHAAVTAYGRIGFEGSELLEVMSEARELLEGEPS